MAESNKQREWKKHVIEEKIGYDEFQNNQSWVGNFSFVIGADTQLGYIWPHVERDATDWKIEMDKAICAIDKINNLTPRPQFVVICGDLVNEMPDSSSEINQLQVNDFKEIFSKLHPSISLVCVCGNHDVGNVPNEMAIDKYHNSFGQDYFSFWCGGVLFLVINTQYYKNCSNVKKHAEEQDRWLMEKLKIYKGRRIIVFQHIPWFLNDIDEKNQYFNIDKTIRLELVEKLYAAGKYYNPYNKFFTQQTEQCCEQINIGVSYVFCGHYHRNLIGFYKTIEIVTTNAVGAPMGPMEPSGLRIVKVYEDNVAHTYYPLEKIPSTISF